jgi:hypothetical protein
VLALRCLLGHLAAVSRAAALALAGVLALAAVVTGLAAAFALARVLAFTSVLLLCLLVSLRVVLGGSRSLPARNEVRSLDAGSSREQARKSSTRDEKLIRFCHFPNVLLNEIRLLQPRAEDLPEDRKIASEHLDATQSSRT